MTIFAIYFGSMIQALCETRAQVIAFLSAKHEEKLNEYTRSHNNWLPQQYGSSDNYSASGMNSYKVIEVEISGGVDLSQYNHYASQPIDGVSVVTNEFFTVTRETYEGNLKVFAEVSNPRAKSHGMTVILAPQRFGSNARPVEEYEALIGTFSRVKATTHIDGYGYATLFFAPESLTNIRIETQMITGNRLTWAE